MKTFLIIPMGGKGQRFLTAGYKVYKPFLKISKKMRIIDGIIKNFDIKKTEIIIIGNRKRIKKKYLNFKNKLHFINIINHKNGPLYSIFLARKKIESIVNNNICFICYSDINWKWDWNKVKKFIKTKKAVVFTHKGFQPHLEINNKSDFCSIKKKNIIDIKEKKLFVPDYKKNFLAIGCYYFKSFSLIKQHMTIFKNKTKFNKEFYLVSLIKSLIKNKIGVNFFNIKNFVHLGMPSQYEDFRNWQDILVDNFNTSLKFKNQNIMLMAGKGKRIKKIGQKKPFLKINKKNIYEYIFTKFGTKKNYIITNKNYSSKLKDKFKTFDIGKSNSMLKTIEKAKLFLKNKEQYWLTSCDCYGNFNRKEFLKFLKQKKPDVVIFAYKFSRLQKILTNAHTAITFKNNKLESISVKNNSHKNTFGHAGFFWIKDYKVFKFIEKFRKNTKINREILVDDYFKYLFDSKKQVVKCFMLSNYIHIGSLKEYYELRYWENYFNFKK